MKPVTNNDPAVAGGVWENLLDGVDADALGGVL
jgi:hypothetical protein